MILLIGRTGGTQRELSGLATLLSTDRVECMPVQLHCRHHDVTAGHWPVEPHTNTVSVTHTRTTSINKLTISPLST